MRNFLTFLGAIVAGLVGVIYARKHSATDPQTTVGDTVQTLIGETGVAIQDTVNKVTARGLRNNNPGNIEYNPDPSQQWQGLDVPPSDGRFCRFVSPDYGFRALGHILINYSDKYGIRTVRGAITRYAPPRNATGEIENNTDAYVQAVSNYLGVQADQPLDFRNWLGVLAQAICVHENGSCPYSSADIENWVRLV